MTTTIYVDGLNFYYGAVSGTPHKWVDFEALSRRLVPTDQIGKIRYFTARVSGVLDPGAPRRQEVLLRAIRANPLVEVHEGYFRADERWLPVAQGRLPDLFRPALRPRWLLRRVNLRSDDGSRRRVKVLRLEEKGSDVNLGAHLLEDVFTQACTKAVVISNDSDLVTPIRMAVARGVHVTVVNPRQGRSTGRLRQVASAHRSIRRSVVAQCQMPDPMVDATGVALRKPAEW